MLSAWDQAPKKIDPAPGRTVGVNFTSLKKKGQPPVALETILQALLFRLREGCSWRALSIFAPHPTIYTRWKQWCRQGLWKRLERALTLRAKGQLWSIASTCVKSHKHAQGGAGGAEK